jgi:DNA-directed RNA polymerase subunit beta
MQGVNNNIRIRRDYSKIKSGAVIPDLIEMQTKSYEKFLQLGVPADQREDYGLQSVLASIFPIHSYDGRFILEFLEYSLEEPKYSVDECKHKDVSYSLPLKMKFRLLSNNLDSNTGMVSVKDVKEQEVYVCDIPVMTAGGTFIVNGTERVVVSQIYRSPGVFFDHDKGKSNPGRMLYGASIIPHIGSWLDIEFDSKDLLYVRIDKRKKISLLCLLRSLDGTKSDNLRGKAKKEGKILDATTVEGMSNEEILDTFYNKLTVNKLGSNQYEIDFVPNFYKGRKLAFDLIDSATKEVLVKADTTINSGILKKIERKNIAKVIVNDGEIIGKNIANTIFSGSSIVIETGEEITKETLESIEKEVNSFEVLMIDNMEVGSYVLNTVLADRNLDRFTALNEIYKIVKSTDAPNIEVAEDLFHSLFFQGKRYDLSIIGRMKMNERFKTDTPESVRVLTKQDIINVIKTLMNIRSGVDVVDDIDHLGNRRVRSVGELIENELRITFTKMEKTIYEKMAAADELVPTDLINVKSVQAILREFFGTSQLSQFMDQTNPLSEITHKRRLSALGPKGLTRERASFEVRDVHVTHYGRICPIETPEGPNIGLINSLAVYSRINRYGFLETPYRKVKKGVVTDTVVYMNATQEHGHVIAQSTSSIDENNKFISELVSCRINGELNLCPPEDIDYIDVSPKQLVSVAAALVPFLENDDANRALMGANMQRQAVPLLRSEAPIVGTGMEGIVARDTGGVIFAHREGIVHYVDSTKIVIQPSSINNEVAMGSDIYNLKKFQRSNHNTCVNQKPLVQLGDYVKAGDIIADGQSIDKGELSLGKNVLVAFVPWNGYNFEDSILISERLVKNDTFTSIHIEEFEVVARDTKLGAEDITSDIPNVGDEALKNLDESGIVYVGADVKPGDILVGKVTPKAENVITAEEKLLRAIFGEKAYDVKDTSLKVPSGITGTVIGVRVFSRRGVDKDVYSQVMERTHIELMSKEREEEYRLLDSSYRNRALDLIDGQEIVSAKNYNKGDILDKNKITNNLAEISKFVLKDKSIASSLSEIMKDFDLSISKINKAYEDKIESLKKGDDLQAGVLKMVKVFIAVKRKLQPGDKMAGRHGNKGVVSKILPIEDMPYLEDGTPVDICLNPLGVPSRMNVGQILEVHLGWAAANIGKQVNTMLDNYNASKIKIEEIREYLLKCYGFNEIEQIKKLTDKEILALCNNIRGGMPVATSVFDGVKEKDIDDLFDLVGLDHSGQSVLYDGRTGEPFEREVTVGYIYMLKLHHLVEDKIHARSIGPYSLITQQPLGGKAQFGGQRFGEMEVWALEAYGAAYLLQEMLTVKSDDQNGRTHVYETIIKGDETFETGIPESFNVLVKELRSLCLNLEMKKKAIN